MINRDYICFGSAFLTVFLLIAFSIVDYKTDFTGNHARVCNRDYGDAFETRFKLGSGCQVKYKNKWVGVDLIQLIDVRFK